MKLKYEHSNISFVRREARHPDWGRTTITLTMISRTINTHIWVSPQEYRKITKKL